MTLPEQTPQEKPKGRKHHLWLIIPWAAFLIAAVAVGAGWFTLRGQTAKRMDAAAEQARDAGWQVEWNSRKISGFPFRVEVVLDGVRVSEPSGWGMSAPQLRAEAYAYALGRWVAYAPEGATLMRPGAAPLTVRAKALRAGIESLNQTPPHVTLQGEALTFTAPAGATPPAFSSAAKLGIFMRPGPDDQGGLLFQLDNAVAEPSRWLGRVAQGRPVTARFDGVFSKAASLKGADWAGMVRAWTDAGGRVTLRNAELSTGDAALKATTGALSAGSDGRLRGNLDAELRQGPRAIAALAQSNGVSPEAAAAAAAVAQARQGGAPLARAAITFEAGQTTLGPVALGPAPRVF